MLKYRVLVGDVLDARVDCLLCTANPWLRMTGGVNGAILGRGNLSIQRELQAHVASGPTKYVDSGAVVETGVGNLEVGMLLHCVAIDGFYRSSSELVETVLRRALGIAGARGARAVATPTLATGYGPLSMEQFARGVAAILPEAFGSVESLSIHVLKERDREAIQGVLGPDFALTS